MKRRRGAQQKLSCWPRRKSEQNGESRRGEGRREVKMERTYCEGRKDKQRMSRMERRR